MSNKNTRSDDRRTMNLRQMQAYRRWDWAGMRGSAACIKWSFRDLQNLDAALRHVKGRSLVVQAGSNLGIFPKRLAEEFAVVHSFEPDPRLLGYARENAPEKNIVYHHAALGSSREPVTLSGERRDNSGRATHEGLTHISGPGVISQILLDDLNLPACDLIYLDIEGYEMHALHGAGGTIAKYKPVIAVEINRNISHYGTSPAELRDWLKARGYIRVFMLNSDEVFVCNRG